jgi:hypothetical protein
MRPDGAGTCLAYERGVVGVQPLVACAKVDAPPDTRLGKYQSLVVAVIAALILTLASVPAVTLPLR